MPFQPTIEETAINTAAAAVTIEISEEYADLHPIAQALIIGANGEDALAQLIEDAQDGDKVAASHIVSIWEDMASVGKLASIRTILNRKSKKLLGFPLTVKDGELIAAKTRNKASKDEASDGETVSESNSKTDFLKTCQSFEKKATPEQIKMALSVLANILNTPQ